MKKQYILLLLAATFITSCNGQNHYDMSKLELDHEYEIFSHTRVYGKDDTEEDIITIEGQFIQELPQAIKAIIARYSTFIPDYMLSQEQENILAESLGYKSLNKAQQSSLKEWDSDFTLTKSPVYLYLIRTEKYIIFKYGFVYGTNYVEDSFEISRTGKITFVDRKDGDRFK